MDTLPKTCQTSPRTSAAERSGVDEAACCAERISIAGASALRLIARATESTLDTTFDGSPESFAQAPLKIFKPEKLLENLGAGTLPEADIRVVKQFLNDTKKKISENV